MRSSKGKKIFVSYARENREYKDELLKYLAPLDHAGRLDVWDDSKILAGDDAEKAIAAALNEAEVALLIVTAEFLASSYCTQKQIPELFKEHEARGLRVVPIIFAPCLWKEAQWIPQIQALPREGKPIGQWRHREEALTHVAEEMRQLLPASEHLSSVTYPPKAGALNRRSGARVYISSTFNDLKRHREELSRLVRSRGHVDASMSHHVVETERDVERSLADVKTCDIYLGIFGFHYGPVPSGQSCSLAELEYRSALDQPRIEKLCFLLSDDEVQDYPVKFVDRGQSADEIARLRRTIQEPGGTQVFTSIQDLCAQVTWLLEQWETRPVETPVSTVAPAPVLVDRVAYTQSMTARYGRVELDALVPPERDEQIRIPLDAVFVEQKARPERPPVELPKEVLQRLVGEGELRADEVPEGVTPEMLQRARDAYRERPAEPVFDLLGRPANRRAVILGDPGSGKSMLTRYILLSLLDSNGNPRVRSAWPATLPILVELRDYAASLAERRTNSLLDYIHHLNETQGFCLRRDALEAHLTARAPTLLLFDGLDELFDPRARETMTREIAGFAADYPSVTIIVTSRPIGYAPRLLQDAGFHHFTLQDLERAQVQQFLRAWFARTMAERPADARQREERILRTVDASRSVRELAGNPLLLTILAIIGKNQELPRERADLYQHAASVLVEHWDVKKHLASGESTYLERPEKLELLRRIAWAMQSAPGGLAGNFLHAERLQKTIEDYLVERFAEPAGKAHALANNIIRRLRERNFILCLRGANLYGFVHRSFLEFFCATAIQLRFEKTQELTLEALKKDLYGKHWEDAAWREVLRLLAGLIAPRFLSEIIEHLLEVFPRPWPLHFNNRLPWNVALAVQCLGELRDLQSLSAVGERLLETTLDLVSHGQGVEDRERNGFLLEEVVPAVEAIGSTWPGQTALRRRLMVTTGVLVWAPLSECWIRIAASVLRNDPEIAKTLLSLARSHDDSRVRTPAAEAVVAIISQQRSALTDLVRLGSSDDSSAIRHAALVCLASVFASDRQTRELLEERLRNDEDMPVRHTALAYLVSTFGVDAQIRELLEERLRSDEAPDVRRAALRALAPALGGDPQFRELLEERVRNDAAPRVRRAALESLVSTFDGDPQLRELLEARLRSDKEGYVRSFALRSLASAFAGDLQTRELFEERLRNDADSDVRVGALDSLEPARHGISHQMSLIDDVARRDESEMVRGTAAALGLTARGAPHMAMLLLSRDADALEPFLDPLTALPQGHLAKVRGRQGLSPEDFEVLLDEVKTHLGWDPRKDPLIR